MKNSKFIIMMVITLIIASIPSQISASIDEEGVKQETTSEVTQKEAENNTISAQKEDVSEVENNKEEIIEELQEASDSDEAIEETVKEIEEMKEIKDEIDERTEEGDGITDQKQENTDEETKRDDGVEFQQTPKVVENVKDKNIEISKKEKTKKNPQNKKEGEAQNQLREDQSISKEDNKATVSRKNSFCSQDNCTKFPQLHPDDIDNSIYWSKNGISSGYDGEYERVEAYNLSVDQPFNLWVKENTQDQIYSELSIEYLFKIILVLGSEFTKIEDTRYQAKIDELSATVYYRNQTQPQWTAVNDKLMLLNGQTTRTSRVTGQKAFDISKYQIPSDSELIVSFSSSITVKKLNLKVVADTGKRPTTYRLLYQNGYFIKDETFTSLVKDPSSKNYYFNTETIFNNTLKTDNKEVSVRLVDKSTNKVVFMKKFHDKSNPKPINKDRLPFKVVDEMIDSELIVNNRSYEVIYTATYADGTKAEIKQNVSVKELGNIKTDNLDLTYTFKKYDPVNKTHLNSLTTDITIQSPQKLDDFENLVTHFLIENEEVQTEITKQINFSRVYSDSDYIYKAKGVTVDLKNKNNHNINIKGNSKVAITVSVDKAMIQKAQTSYKSKPRIWIINQATLDGTPTGKQIDIIHEQEPLINEPDIDKLLINGFEFDQKSATYLSDVTIDTLNLSYGAYDFQTAYYLENVGDEPEKWKVEAPLALEDQILPQTDQDDYLGDSFIGLLNKQKPLFEPFKPLKFEIESLENKVVEGKYVDNQNSAKFNYNTWKNKDYKYNFYAKLADVQQGNQALDHLQMILRINHGDGWGIYEKEYEIKSTELTTLFNDYADRLEILPGSKILHEQKEEIIQPNVPIKGKIKWIIETGVVVMK